MIPCRVHPQPPNFENDVRIPGQGFLTSVPHPRNADWRIHKYWSRIHDYLYDCMNGICAYCATHTPRRKSTNGIDHTSIDHFVPKSFGNHSHAYDWGNFRLCRSRLNNRKADHRDVLDPIFIHPRTFQIDFDTFEIVPNPSISDAMRQAVNSTIARLELNTDDDYVNERALAVYAYAANQLAFADLSRNYPFIAFEMIEQSFDANFLPRFQAAIMDPRIRAMLE